MRLVAWSRHTSEKDGEGEAASREAEGAWQQSRPRPTAGRAPTMYLAAAYSRPPREQEEVPLRGAVM